MENRIYIALDLKSFYASVECVERGLDPLRTNLVVADKKRTKKTICLAVSPSLKVYGISGRARLFEVVQKVREVNAVRQKNAPDRSFSGVSYDENQLKTSPELAVDYIAAPPRMARIEELPEVTITYFQPDKKKKGGAYLTAIGTVKRIDEYERTVSMTDGKKIPIDEIIGIEGNVFDVLLELK